MWLRDYCSAVNMPAQSVMLWTANLQAWDETPSAWLAVLDEAERAQCRLFRRPSDRLAYAAAHALLRRALGASLELSAAALHFSRDQMGKPFLRTPTPGPIDFSLSHTEGMVAVAISHTGPVGVDVEAIDQKSVPRQDWSAYGLSPAEEAHLATLGEPLQSKTFLALWTAREAVAKADGRGLALPLNRIRMQACGTLATVLAQAGELAQHWQLWRYQPSAHHVLTLASQQHCRELIRINAVTGEIERQSLPVTVDKNV